MQYYQPNVRVHYTDCILQNDKSTSTFYLNTKSNSQVFIWCFPIFCFSTSFWVMVSALGCWLRGSSLRIGRVILSSSWERHFVLTVHPPRREARYGCVFGTGACSVRVRVRYGCVSGTVTGKLSGKPNEMLGGYLALDWHPIQRGVVILLVAIETRISSGWVGHVTQIRT